MTDAMRRDEAAEALATVERGRREVLREAGVPAWYLWGLAIGWVALGALADAGNPWATGIGTLVFGAVHAAVFRRAAEGRRRTGRVSIRREAVTRGIMPAVFGSLLLMIGVTIAAAVLAAADGADHPVTMAGVLVAVIILLGGQDAVRLATREDAPADPR